MAENETMVDPFEIAFANEQPKEKKKYNPNMLWNRIKGKTNATHPALEETSVPLEEVLSPEQMEEEKKRQAELDAMPDEEIDVPEIETHVEDLPKEDENEKKLVVEHIGEEEPKANPSSPIVTDDMIDEALGIEKEEQPVAEGSAGTPSAEMPEEETGDIGGNKEDPKVEETESDDAKRERIMNELKALAQDDLEDFKYDPSIEKWTPKQKQDAIKSHLSNRAKKNEPKEEPKKEEPKDEVPPMTDEEALAEARMMAQDDLDGFEVNGPDWSKLTTKEKFQVIENFKNKGIEPKDEIHNESTENNYEAYKRYPTGLKVAEDVLEGANNVANRMANAAKTNLAGGESISNAVNRASIPHYDYRSFFK